MVSIGIITSWESSSLRLVNLSKGTSHLAHQISIVSSERRQSSEIVTISRLVCEATTLGDASN